MGNNLGKPCEISVILISQFTLKLIFLTYFNIFRIPINKFIYKQIKLSGTHYFEEPNLFSSSL